MMYSLYRLILEQFGGQIEWHHASTQPIPCSFDPWVYKSPEGERDLLNIIYRHLSYTLRYWVPYSIENKYNPGPQKSIWDWEKL